MPKAIVWRDCARHIGITEEDNSEQWKVRKNQELQDEMDKMGVDPKEINVFGDEL